MKPTPEDKPDRNCYTLPDGDCIGGPCMHNPGTPEDEKAAREFREQQGERWSSLCMRVSSIHGPTHQERVRWSEQEDEYLATLLTRVREEGRQEGREERDAETEQIVKNVCELSSEDEKAYLVNRPRWYLDEILCRMGVKP